MANWSAYKESEIGLPVFKRAKHGIHFQRSDGQIQAEFCGKPCHYLDGGIWKAIDTRPLLRKDGSYGCPHSDVIIKPDGTVQVGKYAQKAALIYPGKMSIDGDRIARPFSGGVQYLYITEDGFRQEIVLEKMPDLKKVSALVDTVSGVLPSKYTASSLSLKDSSTAELSSFVQVDSKSLASVLEAAKYPLTIDPDFAGGTADYSIYGDDADYATASSTSDGTFIATIIYVGQSKPSRYRLYRGLVIFDTSTVDDDATITQANLTLTATDDDSTTDFDVQIVKYVLTGTRETDWDGVLSSDADSSIWRNTSGMSKNTPYASGNLSTAWINKTGNTGYGLRSSRDKNGDVPTGYEFIHLASASHATEGYRPVLSVTYTAATSGNPYYYFRQQ